MYNKILILAPHTDDGELGMGGSIAKFIEEGKEVFIAAFSILFKSTYNHKITVQLGAIKKL